MENQLLFWSWTLAFYLWHTFGVTIGLHRLLSHRAFRCHKAVEYFFVFGAYFAYHGAPIWWATIHRTHHKYVDTPLDPHSPRQGILHAYFFYRAFRYPPHMDPARQCPDLLKDPVYRALETRGDWKLGYVKCVAACLVFRALIYLFFGYEVMMASFLAGFLAWNVPLLVNIVCHIPRLGYKNFQIADDSVNNYLFAVVALGDGWHNNHHAHPGSSQMGLLKHEFDASWFVLKCLQKVGLVYSINETMRADSTNENAIIDAPAEELTPDITVSMIPAAENGVPEEESRIETVPAVRKRKGELVGSGWRR